MVITAEKLEEAAAGVCARMVVKDIARGAATARAQGISSPTPSAESLLLGIARGAWGIGPMALYAIGVSQAFMNALLENQRVVVKMPLSVSTTSGEPVYLEARNGLNGLRVGSLAWVVFFSKLVKQAGLE